MIANTFVGAYLGTIETIDWRFWGGRDCRCQDCEDLSSLSDPCQCVLDHFWANRSIYLSNDVSGHLVQHGWSVGWIESGRTLEAFAVYNESHICSVGAAAFMQAKNSFDLPSVSQKSIEALDTLFKYLNVSPSPVKVHMRIGESF